MLVAFARNAWRVARYPARQLAKGKLRVPSTLNGARALAHEFERYAPFRNDIDWITYRSGALSIFEVEVKGMKHNSEVEDNGDFAKINQEHFMHVFTAQVLEDENFSLDELSENESIIIGHEETNRVLISKRIENMLCFINTKMHRNSPALSESVSSQ